MTPEELRELEMLELEKLQAEKLSSLHGSVLKPKESGWQDFKEGAKYSGLETYYGAKDLADKLSDEERAGLADLKQDYSESGWGTAGRVVGELGQFAMPYAGVLKLAKGLGAGAKTLSALPLATDVAVSAGHGAVRLPGQGESRGGNAAMQSGFALGGNVLGRTLAVPFTGIKGSPVGERLRDAGVKLTPGQVKEGLLRNIENFGEYLMPVFSAGVRKGRKRADDTMRDMLYVKAAPPTPDTLFSLNPVKAQPTSMKELIKAYDDAYSVAWPKVKDADPELLYKMLQYVEDVKDELPSEVLATLKTTVNGAIKRSNNPNASLAELDELFRNRMKYTAESRLADEHLGNIRTLMKENMPISNRQAIGRVDATYGDRVALGHAVTQKGAALERQTIGPDDVMAGTKASSSKRQMQSREGNLQREAEDWFEVKGKPPGMLGTVSRRFVQMFPDFGTMRLPSDMVAGNYAYQKAMRDLLKRGYHEGPGRYALDPERLAAAYEE